MKYKCPKCADIIDKCNIPCPHCGEIVPCYNIVRNNAQLNLKEDK